MHQAVSLAEDAQRGKWVDRARNFAKAHRGATARMADRIAKVARL